MFGGVSKIFKLLSTILGGFILKFLCNLKKKKQQSIHESAQIVVIPFGDFYIEDNIVSVSISDMRD